MQEDAPLGAGQAVAAGATVCLRAEEASDGGDQLDKVARAIHRREIIARLMVCQGGMLGVVGLFLPLRGHVVVTWQALAPVLYCLAPA